MGSLPSTQHMLKKAAISRQPFRGLPSPGSPSTGKATETRRPKDTGVGQPGSRSSVRPGRGRLSTWRNQSSRAGEQPFCRLLAPLPHLPWAPYSPSKDIQRIQEPPPPQFSHSYRNIHRALTLCTGIVLNTFHEFSFNSHNTPLTQAFPSPLTYGLGKLTLTEANGLLEVTRLAGGQTQ